jgi:hypothetical protein
MDPIHENIKQQRELAPEIIACVEAGPDLAQSGGPCLPTRRVPATVRSASCMSASSEENERAWRMPGRRASSLAPAGHHSRIPR